VRPEISRPADRPCGIARHALCPDTSPFAAPRSFLPVKVEDFTILAVFLLVTVLTCSFAEVTQSLTVEIEARTEADLAAELARLLLRAPDLKTALPTASRRLACTLGLPLASIQIGAVASDGRHVTFSLHDDGRLGTLLVPSGLKKPELRRLRDRVVPSLEVLMQAAQEREDAAAALKASRSHIVAATDEARRRIERDLHDGTQQRLSHSRSSCARSRRRCRPRRKTSGDGCTRRRRC
jgi:signal transduction histidine kinase